jgi:hypothetical protein
MRTYWRQRNDLVQSASRHILRMQKALTQMNVQLANVLSDISGVTGQAIIKAILAGERDPHKLAELRDPRVQASEEQKHRHAPDQNTRVAIYARVSTKDKGQEVENQLCQLREQGGSLPRP